MDDETHHLMDLQQAHRRRLRELEKQAAIFGLHTPPEIVTEIHDLLRTITQLDKQLGPAAPRILREPVPDFVGRGDEDVRLVQNLSQIREGGAAAICCVRGMGGIGKTELAYAVASHLTSFFPDGQILVELRGASSNPLPAALALQTIIRSFDRMSQLPDDLTDLQRLYRTVLMGKRVLILADDAQGAAQVRPLVPPTGCALLITSRMRFTLPGMVPVDLGTLPDTAAAQLLVVICPRLNQVALRLAKLCGHLPLALRVSAALLANDDTLDIERYLARLADARTKLAHLRDPDDPALDVEAALALTYDALDTEAQNTLCQLSVFPSSFDLAAAQVIVEGADDLNAVQSGLRRRSLVEWAAATQRLALHDLVRAFAASRLVNGDVVQFRYAQYYAQVAQQVDTLYKRGGNTLVAGLQLFDTERINIETGWNWALQRAGSADIDALLLDYAGATSYVSDVRADFRRDRDPKMEATVEAARRLGNKGAEARFLEQLGNAYSHAGDHQRAIDCYEQRLRLAQEIGHRQGESRTLASLGDVYDELGDIERAIDHYEQSLAIAREIGDRRGPSRTLGALGRVYRRQGDIQRAIGYYEQQVALARELGEYPIESSGLSSLGLAYAILKEWSQVVKYYEQALAIDRSIDDREGEAWVCWQLGVVLEQQSNLARAVELMQVSVDFYRAMAHQQTEQFATYLERVRQKRDQAP